MVEQKICGYVLFITLVSGDSFSCISRFSHIHRAGLLRVHFRHLFGSNSPTTVLFFFCLLSLLSGAYFPFLKIYMMGMNH